LLSHAATDNVIPLYGPYGLPDSFFFDSEEITSEDSASSAILMDEHTNILFLEGLSPANIQKAAVDIHEISERWAYLRFHDIKDQIQSVQDLIDLGSLTLFIEDILSINPFHREIISEYLKGPQLRSQPLLLIGSATSFRDLQAQDMLHPDLVRVFGSHLLEIDRLPRGRALFREVIEMVL
jgi:hypothetical protein